MLNTKLVAEQNRLTDKQLKFIQYRYIDGLNLSDAVIKAGYECKNSEYANSIGCQLQRSSKIKAYVSDMKQGRSLMPKFNDGQVAVLVDDYNWKVNKLKLVVNRSIPDELPDSIEARRLLRAGEGLAAIAELNRMQGHIAPTKSVNVDIKADDDIKRLLTISNRLLIEYNNNSTDKM